MSSPTIAATPAGFIITFRYHPALVAAVKELPGRRYDPLTKQWSVPLSAAPVLAQFAQQWHAIVEADAEALLLPHISEPIAVEAPSFPPTAEQQHVIDRACTGGDLKVSAYAGAGKTSTLALVAAALDKLGKRGAYFVFGTANAKEAQSRFPSSVESRTTHAFANRLVNARRRFAEKLDGRLYPSKIAELLDLPSERFGRPRLHLVYAIQSTVRAFCNSADREIGWQHIAAKDLDPFTPGPGATPEHAAEMDRLRHRFIVYVLPLAQKLWESQIDEKQKDVAMSHDHYLKLWQLSGELLRVDYILVDESQDLNPVTLAIIEAHRCQKIWVGDTHQQIFAWRGAVNAMEAVAAPETFITQSFRWGQAIADVANAVLALKGPLTHPVRGFEQRSTVIGAVAETQRYTLLCRGNGALFTAALDAVLKGRRIAVVGSLKDPISMMETAHALKAGTLAALREKHPDIRGFLNWEELQHAAQNDLSLERVVRLVEQHGDQLPDMIAQLRQAGEVSEEKADIVLSTAHKAKGREWATVKLGQDYCSHLAYIRKGEPLRVEELNILYVAATRATEHLELNRAAAELLDSAAVEEAFEEGRAA